MATETIFDGMVNQGWTVDASRDGLKGAFQSTMVDLFNYDSEFTSDVRRWDFEKTMNQLMCFMVRDLERRG